MNLQYDAKYVQELLNDNVEFKKLINAYENFLLDKGVNYVFVESAGSVEIVEISIDPASHIL
jgi:hypothetical protein